MEKGERRKVEHDGINERGIKRESDKGVEPCLCAGGMGGEREGARVDRNE